LRLTLRQTPDLLIWAFGISIAAHLVLFGGYELGKKFSLWERDFLPAWLRRITHALTLVQVPKPTPQQQQQQPAQPEIPLVFVEVDPAATTTEAPKNATHYSSHNSVAANPDTLFDTPLPKLNGAQTHVPKTESAPRTKNFPLQPSFNKPANTDDAAESKPKGGQKMGDLAMAKPSREATDSPEPGDAEIQPHQRPRTLEEARARQNLMPGEMMHQDGGVHRQRLVPSFDAIGTPFGEYDAEIIRAIELHWYDLIDQQTFARDQSGRVVLDFKITYDGRITDMHVVESTVDEIYTYLCQRAVQEPAPYAPWPRQMRLLIGSDVRQVRFTFFYE